ncbi:MAG TPA: glycerol kinase GlpK [Candidatus Blautia stercoravium]|nr:glycerol kinase GlpK [Candidatus Blautia stercoravium]
MGKYIIGIDQSTQGTKALLFDEGGDLIARADFPHRQIIDERGWVEHDPEEFYSNVIQTVKNVIEKAGVNKEKVVGVGISNQRETALAWDRTGKPIYNAVVWQCARGEDICERIKDSAGMIKERTGLQLSPYFSAAKIAWILENVEGARSLAQKGRLCYGTVDTFLVYRLTAGKVYRTDYSNASRTQLFNIRTLSWDEEICDIFGISGKNLAEVTDSDGYYGETDFEGYLEKPIPIHGVLGDSHGALFGQGCLEKGMVKATYGTGSSVMMNVGEEPVFSKHGVVSSLAWGMGGKVNYVLEGNINYTGAVITWLTKDLKLVGSPSETEKLAFAASTEDRTYLVPAFTGLGAPYWDSKATGILCGITRTTNQAEIVRAALDCIVYQITDILKAMEDDSGISIQELRVDGGPTKNKYLMQFQSDIAGIPVKVPTSEELSGIGAAYAAGIGLGVYDRNFLFSKQKKTTYEPKMNQKEVDIKYMGWKEAVELVLEKS